MAAHCCALAGGPKLHDVVADVLSFAVDLLEKFDDAVSADVCQLLTTITTVDAYGHALKLQHLRGRFGANAKHARSHAQTTHNGARARADLLFAFTASLTQHNRRDSKENAGAAVLIFQLLNVYRGTSALLPLCCAV